MCLTVRPPVSRPFTSPRITLSQVAIFLTILPFLTPQVLATWTDSGEIGRTNGRLGASQPYFTAPVGILDCSLHTPISLLLVVRTLAPPRTV